MYYQLYVFIKLEQDQSVDRNLNSRPLFPFTLDRNNSLDFLWFQVLAPAIIVLTFILFVIVPDLIMVVFEGTFDEKINVNLATAVLLFYQICGVSDALTYVEKF